MTGLQNPVTGLHYPAAAAREPHTGFSEGKTNGRGKYLSTLSQRAQLLAHTLVLIYLSCYLSSYLPYLSLSIYPFSTRAAPRAHSRADLSILLSIFLSPLSISIYLPFLNARSSSRTLNYLSVYFPPLSISILSQRAQLLAHTTALVRRRVLLPVPLAAVRRHLAPTTRDVDFCSLLASRAVAEPSQLFAKTLVLGPM